MKKYRVETVGIGTDDQNYLYKRIEEEKEILRSKDWGQTDNRKINKGRKKI